MKYFFYLLCGCACLSLQAQEVAAQRDSLSAALRQIAALSDSTEKTAAMDAFVRTFETVLQQPRSMDMPFDSLPYIGTLCSDDGRVRIFTWILPLSDTLQRYYGVVQYRLPDNRQHTALLTDRKDLPVRPELAELRGGEWFGALYYRLVQTKVGRQTCYTLIGYDFYQYPRRRKVLDVLTFDAQGQPVFGAPVFDNGQRRLHRVLFPFDDGMPFYLDYLPRKKMIVYPRMQLEILPDGFPARATTDVFDGLVFKKDRWLLQQDVLLRPEDFRK